MAKTLEQLFIQPVFKENVGLGFVEGTYLTSDSAKDLVHIVNTMSISELLLFMDIAPYDAFWRCIMTSIIHTHTDPLEKVPAGLGSTAAIIARDNLSKQSRYKKMVFFAMVEKLASFMPEEVKKPFSTKDLLPVKAALEGKTLGEMREEEKQVKAEKTEVTQELTYA